MLGGAGQGLAPRRSGLDKPGRQGILASVAALRAGLDVQPGGGRAPSQVMQTGAEISRHLSRKMVVGLPGVCWRLTWPPLHTCNYTASTRRAETPAPPKVLEVGWNRITRSIAWLAAAIPQPERHDTADHA